MHTTFGGKAVAGFIHILSSGKGFSSWLYFVFELYHTQVGEQLAINNTPRFKGAQRHGPTPRPPAPLNACASTRPRRGVREGQGRFAPRGISSVSGDVDVLSTGRASKGTTGHLSQVRGNGRCPEDGPKNQSKNSY